MNEKSDTASPRNPPQSRHTGECAGAWGIVGLFVAVWVLAYTFAVMGWNIAGAGPNEGDFATGWHELGASFDLTKRQ